MDLNFKTLKNKYLPILVELCPLYFLVLINQILFKTHGQYSLKMLNHFSIGAILIFGFYLFSKNKNLLKTNKLLPSLLIIFSLYGLVPVEIYDNRPLPIFVHLPYVPALIAGIIAFLKPKSKYLSHIYITLIVLLLGILLFVVYCTKEPYIDIWYIFTDASKAILKGINPYELTYQDIYKGTYIPFYGDPHLVYWPINMIFCFVGYLLGDVRIGVWIAIVLTLIGLFKLAKQNGISTQNALLIGLLFLNFSVGIYEFFYCWTETFILPFLVFGCYYFQQRKIVLLGIMIGLLAGTKQSMLMYLILFMALMLAQFSFKEFIKLTLVSFITFVAIILPFVLLNPALFYKHTVTDLVNYLPRTDSLSWVSYLISHYKIPYNQSLFGAAYMLICLVFAVVVYFKKSMSTLFYLVVVLYFIVFMTAKQSFCNYYYLLEFFALMWVLYSRIFKEKVETES
jgi:hypothetical protein